VWKRFEAQEGQSRRSRVIGTVRSTRDIAYRGSQVEAPNCCNETCDIAIHDIPTRSEPSISGTRVRRSRGVGVRRIGVSEVQETLAAWNRETRYPDGRVVWATVRVSGGQVAYHIGDREKVSPESFGIRIRDPANSEIPTEVTGGGKVNPHVCIGVSAHRGSEVGNSIS
jgi:hypothetical protein